MAEELSLKELFIKDCKLSISCGTVCAAERFHKEHSTKLFGDLQDNIKREYLIKNIKHLEKKK